MEYQIGTVVPLDYPRRPLSSEAAPPAWYIFRTPPQKEKNAKIWLEHLGALDAWFPLESVWRVKPNRQKVQAQKLIAPRYVFAQFAHVINWDAMFRFGRGRITGVVGSTTFKSSATGEVIAMTEPLRIPVPEIAAMKYIPERIAMDQQAERAARDAAIAANIPGIGEVGIITAGPFHEFQVQTEKVHNGILYGLIDIFGRATPVKIPVEDVRKSD